MKSEGGQNNPRPPSLFQYSQMDLMNIIFIQFAIKGSNANFQ